MSVRLPAQQSKTYLRLHGRLSGGEGPSGGGRGEHKSEEQLHFIRIVVGVERIEGAVD